LKGIKITTNVLMMDEAQQSMLSQSEGSRRA
jgi:hypothetical protein